MRLSPRLSVSVVERTTPGAFATASISALSCFGVVCSVNWMSIAIAFAPALVRFSITRASSERGNGQRVFGSSLKVVSSTPTTTISSGVACVPRTAKRASTLCASSVRISPVA